MMSGLLAALLVVGLEPAGRAFGADCDRSLSACSALLQQQDVAAANQTQLAGVDQQIAYSTGAIAALAQVVAQLQGQVEDQQSQIQATSARLDVLGRQVRFTQADVERRQVEVTIHQQLLYHRVRELDKAGAISYLELLVTSTSFSQLVNRVATIDKVIGGDRRMVDELKQDRAGLQGLRDQLERDRAQQQLLLNQQQKQLARLAQEQQAQRGAYAAQTALEAQLESRRQALQAEKASIGAQLQSLQGDYQRQLSSLLAQRQAGGGPAGTFSIYTDLRVVPQVDMGALNAYFAGTAFAGLGPAFVNAGRRHGVNPLYLVAHAIEESAFGTSQMAQAKNNLFGIAAYDSNPDAAMSFPSFQACVEYEAQFVRRDYLDPQGAFYRGPNLKGMNVNYASDRRWASNIAAIYLTLPGGLNAV
jgi:peptidoglycan hydrolase CwlO-like protein